jgi:hypothetical protein
MRLWALLPSLDHLEKRGHSNIPPREAETWWAGNSQLDRELGSYSGISLYLIGCFRLIGFSASQGGILINVHLSVTLVTVYRN